MSTPENSAGKATRKRKRSLEERLYDVLGQDWCGTIGPPANRLVLYAKDTHFADLTYVFSTLNDGFEIGIGYPHEWFCILRKDVALRGAWFIIWTWWIRGTWCGLRTAIWYWLLDRRVNRYPKCKPQPAAEGEGMPVEGNERN